MKSSLKMLPTFLHDVPNTSQKGLYVALDLGGTNLRFFKIELKGDYFSFSSKHYPVPEVSMKGNRDDLFDFLANCLKEGLEESNLEKEFIPFVGFTFSFPVLQTSLCSGSLISWTKGFDVTGVVGEDVSKLMKDAALKIGVFFLFLFFIYFSLMLVILFLLMILLVLFYLVLLLIHIVYLVLLMVLVLMLVILKILIVLKNLVMLVILLIKFLLILNGVLLVVMVN